MNLPNKITMFRVFMIPVFVVLLMVDAIPYNNFIALAVFAVACFSDFLDGYLARKYHLVTTFGKLMDPLADKVLVCTAMILLIELGKLSSIIAAVIIAREFIISGFRQIAADKGVVIAAGYLGKFKTVAQMFMCICMLFTVDSTYDGVFFDIINVAGEVFMWLALVLTVVSLVEYLWANRQVMKEDE